MRVFFDFEFTGLHQNTTPISVGMITENDMMFYAEFSDFDSGQITPWIKENVIKHLRCGHKGTYTITVNPDQTYSIPYYIDKKEDVRERLEAWLAQFESVEFWGDHLAYDWILFCELFGGGADCLPKHIYYIPFDLCTLFWAKGIDADINRIEFSGMKATKHNALDDARVVKACFERLMNEAADN